MVDTSDRRTNFLDGRRGGVLKESHLLGGTWQAISIGGWNVLMVEQD